MFPDAAAWWRDGGCFRSLQDLLAASSSLDGAGISGCACAGRANEMLLRSRSLARILHAVEMSVATPHFPLRTLLSCSQVSVVTASGAREHYRLLLTRRAIAEADRPRHVPLIPGADFPLLHYLCRRCGQALDTRPKRPSRAAYRALPTRIMAKQLRRLGR